MPAIESSRSAAIVWFRADLRLEDQPALCAAIEQGGPVYPVYIHAPEEEGEWAPGAAARWWLHQALDRLDAALRERGSRLLIRRGPTGAALKTLLRETGATAVYWNRRYEPLTIARDAGIKTALTEAGITAKSFNGSLLFEPWTIQTAAKTPFQVFTPFWRKCQSQTPPAAPLDSPARLPTPLKWPDTVALDTLGLEPKIRWDEGLRASWTPGAAGAQHELQRFLKGHLRVYAVERDRPDHDGTSRLSPYLHTGEISPRQTWHAALQKVAPRRNEADEAAAEPWLRQLVWREFAFHLLYHFPHTPTEPLRGDFAKFPWESDAEALHAWQRGQTGFPYIDAGMRQLWATGWMHNRVRMAVASFLVKDLLLPWQAGARWFWDTLVDADLANNTLGWQWTAGCGADAAPYFRIFNPVSQGTKFDPAGNYIRRWVPELARLPTEWIHEPWKAFEKDLATAGVRLGETYPRPIVDHATARVRALEALQQMKQAAVTREYNRHR